MKRSVGVTVPLPALALLTFLALPFLALPVGAQWDAAPPAGPSILNLLPTDGRAIEAEGMVEGVLGEGDYVSAFGQPVQAWEFYSVGGETMTFDLVSDAFDAFLFMVAGGLEHPQEDDDSGGACHARITHTFPEEGGLYRIIVSRVGPGSGGEFALYARSDPPPPLEEGCGGFPGESGEWFEGGRELPEGLSAHGRRIEAPGEVEGFLSLEASPLRAGGAALDGWELELEAGQSVVIDVESEDFDTYLYLDGPGLEFVLSDDDGGGDLNSRIRFTAEVSGVFLVVVSSFSEAEGAYRLTVRPSDR